MLTEPHALKDVAQDLVGIEMLGRNLAGGTRMTLVVAFDLRDRVGGFVKRLEREQALARGNDPIEARVLHHDGPAGGEVADTSTAEPTGMRRDVEVLGHA